MTTPSTFEESERLRRLREASEWLLRLRDADRNEQSLDEWLRWCDADPQHFAEFERLQRDWIDLEALKNSQFMEPARESAWLRGGRQLLARGLAWRRPGVLVAAVAAVAVTLVIFHRARPPVAAGQQMAAVLTSRAATLPDGSRMILGTQSRVDMNFNGSKRRLDISKGQAYFKVHHDRSRPFVVQAGGVSVTAVGTAFDVRRDQDRVTVTVEEGVVEVSSPANDQRPATWRAEAGYQFTYSIVDRTASLTNVDIHSALAWRNGELAYVREPLRTVVEDLNRYSSRKIFIDDPEIAALPFTGTAFAASVDDWLAGIEQAYPITLTRRPDGSVILSRRKPAQAVMAHGRVQLFFIHSS